MSRRCVAFWLGFLLASAAPAGPSWAGPSFYSSEHSVEETWAYLTEHLAWLKDQQVEVRRLRALEEARMVGLGIGGDAVAGGAAAASSQPPENSATPVTGGAVPQQETVPVGQPQPVKQGKSSSVLLADQGGVAWLSGQNDPSVTGIVPIAGREGLLVSYNVPPGDSLQFFTGRSWTYDNAMGAAALLAGGDAAGAREVLAALDRLVTPSGTTGFSYQVDSSYVDGRVRTGALAWVGYAMAFYQRSTGDASFQASAERIAGYLKTLQHATGSLRGGPDVNWVSTEHNVDAYFFFRELFRVTGAAAYLATAGQIRDSLLANHWVGSGKEGHFLQGLNDPTPALDANALGAIFLKVIGDSKKAGLALKYVESVFKNTQTIAGSAATITGYSPDSAGRTVWLEGTLQAAVAYERAGNQKKADRILAEVNKLQADWQARGLWHGALPYAMPRYVNSDGDTFSDLEAVASTAWLTLAQEVLGGSSLFWDRD